MTKQSLVCSSLSLCKGYIKIVYQLHLSKKLQQMDIVGLLSAMPTQKAVDGPLQEKSIINSVQANVFLTDKK